MVGPSKILTVSYGTFSCTLEGFDEPFSTMKAIAEYFRDLAADDRYFGAEPPQPDAEMLGRIAEKEIQRRVEAKVGATGIVLRQTDTAADRAPVVAPAAAVPAPPAAPPAAPVEVPVAAPAAAVSAPDESVAAKLMRIRAAVAAARATPVAQVYDVEDDTPAAPVTPFAEPAAQIPPVAEPPVEDTATSAPDTAATAPVGTADAEAGAQDVGHAATTAAASATAVAADAEEESFRSEPAAQAEEIAEPSAEAMQRDADDAALKAEFDVMSDVVADAPVALTAPAEEEGVPASEGSATGAVDDTPDTAEDTAPAASEPDFDMSGVLAEVAAPGTTEADALPDHSADLDAEDDDDGSNDEDSGSVLSRLAARAAAESGLQVDWIDPTDAPAAMADRSDAETHDQDETARADAQVEDAADAVTAEIAEAPEADATYAPDAAEAGVALAAVIEDVVAVHIADHTGTMAAQDDVLGAVAGMVAGPDATDGAPVTGIAEAVEIADAADPSDDDLMAALRDAGVETAPVEGPGIDLEIPVEPTVLAAEAAPEPASAPAPEPSEAPGLIGRARARVIKVRRSLTDSLAAAPDDADKAATDTGAPAAFAPEPKAAQAAVPADALLSDDDEADLVRQLAEAAGETADRREPHEGREILAGAAADDDAAVERLMEEANTKLEGPESRRRLSAIAHLKAAVAATVADRKMQRSDTAADPRPAQEGMEDRYRDDLSKAVRPRRPAPEGPTATRRPQIDSRPAPLVLVSELRVDRPMSETIREAAVVRPRRISAGNLALSEDDDDLDTDAAAPLSSDEAKNFAEFAERVGAASLPDLLEAAAVYTATVEGIPHFSRPHVLRKVASASDEGDFNREDGLRSFGLLLRQGKIQKVRRGQFSVTDSSRFMSEARSATR